jgi:beta-glucosidase
MSLTSLNGVPSCTNKWLLTDVVRREFGFRGYVITDWGAIDFTVTAHKYYNSTLDAVAAAANAGVNLELPDLAKPTYLLLYEAVQKKMVSYDTIIELVKPLFYTRMRLGEFDPPDSNPYASIDNSSIENPIHRELAVQAAAQSFVLLKNADGTLPFRTKIGRLAVSDAVF